MTTTNGGHHHYNGMIIGTRQFGNRRGNGVQTTADVAWAPCKFLSPFYIYNLILLYIFLGTIRDDLQPPPRLPPIH
jgi:hypothetical protein